MPPLRQRLKRRRVAVAAVVAFAALLALDAALPPQHQVLGKAAVFAIDGYQSFGRPVTRRFATCRFHPSCSEYAEIAIARQGFWPGVVRSVGRLSRCRAATPMGTIDEP